MPKLGSSHIKQLSLSWGESFATAGYQPVVSQPSSDQACYAPPILLNICINPPEVTDTVISCNCFFPIYHSEIMKEKRKTTYFSPQKINSSSSRKVCFRTCNSLCCKRTLAQHFFSYVVRQESHLAVDSCSPWFYFLVSTALDNSFFLLLWSKKFVVLKSTHF